MIPAGPARILALESSCDETALAVFDSERGIVGEWIHSQIALHGRHGGVVPDLATREHLRNFAPLIGRALAETALCPPSPVPRPPSSAHRPPPTASVPPPDRLTAVAVTYGPGLAACLAMGLAAAKSLALALELPLVGVNHLRGHAWSPFIPIHAASPSSFADAMEGLLPHLGLVVSGGNTLLLRIGADRKVTVIATTRDDAAGEALDKGAKLLGLGYPGGPAVERLAAEGRRDAYDFPRGVGPRRELAFSFSGVKTSLRYLLEKMSPAEIEARRPDLCASYQQAVIDALVRKTMHALEQADGACRSLGLSGGVANNTVLRAAMTRLALESGMTFLPAEPRHTGDNAGMIAFAAWLDRQCSDSRGLELPIEPGLEL